MASPIRILALRVDDRTVTSALFDGSARRTRGSLCSIGHAGSGGAEAAIAACVGATLEAGGTPDDRLAAVGICTEGSAPQGYLAAAAPARWGQMAVANLAPPLSMDAAGALGCGCADGRRIALRLGNTASAATLTASDAGGGAPGLHTEEVRRGLQALVAGPTPAGGRHAEVLALPGMPADAEDALAARSPDCHGLTLGFGVPTAATPLDLLHATMEAVALDLADLRGSLQDALPEPAELTLYGPLVERSLLWANTLADALGAPVALAEDAEADLLGAAIHALVHAGLAAGAASLAPPPGPLVRHDPGRHAILRRARARRGAV